LTASRASESVLVQALVLVRASVLDQGSAAHEPRPRLATIRLTSVRMLARLMSTVRSSRSVHPHQHGLVWQEIRSSELSDCRAMIGDSVAGLIDEPAGSK